MDVKYHLDEKGRFVIEDYNRSKPFSGFFPGIAGVNGRPIWAFFVNRAQCIASFGVKNKDGAILEFQPANRAYVLVNTHGFRTFVKLRRKGKWIFYEPFKETTSYQKKQVLEISPDFLQIKEYNPDIGLELRGFYICIPREDFGALVRRVILRNISKVDTEIEVIDGLPYLFPYGLTERLTKDMSNTIQGWMEVVRTSTGVPFYKLKVFIADKPIVTPVKSGNFFIGTYYKEDGTAKNVPVIIDPTVVFGDPLDLAYPYNFFKEDFVFPKEQISGGITPSGMGYIREFLRPEEVLTLDFFIGHISSIEELEQIESKLRDKTYFERKLRESKSCVDEVCNYMATSSNIKEFDLYCRNTFLDNVLRGGFPVTLNKEKKVVLHLYSRKHGDVERDYNRFYIEYTNYSQGDGNFRDVCQNRRNDIWFNPDLFDDNIRTFVNLIQLDGVNPLVTKGDRFVFIKVDENELKRIFGKESKELHEFLVTPFSLGEAIDFIKEKGLKIDRAKLIQYILQNAKKETEAEFREGYWIDHWTYINDLIESFREIYPDKYFEIFMRNDYMFYDSPAIILPREERYVYKEGVIRQYGSVYEDPYKEKLLNSRKLRRYWARTRYGKGRIYYTTLLAKLICLVANKSATFDPQGVGIEMEADRPGWYDALNGLPGLFGSSVNEVFELKRLVQIITEVLEKKKCKVKVPVELGNFIKGLLKVIDDSDYWEKSNSLKERYRKKTALGISGHEVELSWKLLLRWLKKVEQKVDCAINSAFDKKKGIYHTYYINEVVEWEYIRKSGKPKKNHLGYPCVKALKFKSRPLPPFLEAQVHAMRIVRDKKLLERIYNSVRKNGLYDKKLKMYKVNASLAKESLEIGRTKVFTPGWLENESIWLHMEYKYLLELLRNGMYKEFFTDLRNTLIPFQDPYIYGRNILENCSFIVSSAHPDVKLHGTGFLPRLTGATAEFINMWLWMCFGRSPFRMEKDKLILKFSPVLPGWLFDKDGKFKCRFLGEITVIYHNPSRKDTFGPDGVSILKIVMDDSEELKGDTIPMPFSLKIREREIRKIDVYLGRPK